jgi:hypothetical protein
MATARLPLRVRIAVGALAVVALLVVAGAAVAVRVGAQALDVGGGFVVSSVYSPAAGWVGIEVSNRSAFPITLRSVQPRTLLDADILEARVLDRSGAHVLLSREPLEPELQTALDRSHPLDGFVLPPHSGADYQVVVRFRPRTPGEQVVIAREAITYSAFGLDHGALSDGIYCVRAPGAASCTPYEGDLDG